MTEQEKLEKQKQYREKFNEMTDKITELLVGQRLDFSQEVLKTVGYILLDRSVIQ